MLASDYVQKIISLQRKRDYEAAYSLLLEGLSLYPTNTFMQSSEIYLLFKLNRRKDARQKAEARLGLFKNNPFFLKTYIEILLKDRATDEALRFIEKILSSDIRDELLYLFMADVAGRIVDKKRAKEIIHAGLLMMPESSKLKERFDQLNQDDSGESTSGYYRERFRGKTPDEVIGEIEAIMVIPEYSKDISLRFVLAEAYKKKGDISKATRTYHDILKEKDTPFVRKMLGYAYYRMEDYDNAILFLRDMFISHPDDHALFATVSKILEKKGDLKLAESIISEALSSHPGAKNLYGILKRLKKG